MASETQPDATSTSTNGAAETNRALVAVNNRLSQLPALPWGYAGPAPRPEILSSRPTPVDLLHALRRRWLLAVGLGLVLAGLLAGLVWMLVPVRYEALSLVRISKVKMRVFDDQNSGGEEFDTYKRTQQQLVKSNFVLLRAVRKPEMAKLRLIQEHKSDPVNYLDGQVAVDYPGDAELLRVAMKGTLRDELPVIVNAVVDSYMDEIVNAERNEQLKRRDTLERAYAKNREEIRKKSTALHQLAKQLGTSESETAMFKKKLALDHINNLNYSRSKLKDQLRDQDMKIVLLKTRDEHPNETQVPDYLIDSELSHDSLVQQNLNEISRIRRAIKAQEGLHRAPKMSMGIKRMKQDLASLEEAIEERKAEIRPEISRKYSAGQGGGVGNFALPMLESEREIIVKNLEQVEGELIKSIEEVAKLDANSAELERAKAELDELNQITSKMGSQLRIWNLELENQPRIQVVEKASRPQTNDAMKKYLGVAFAALCGFGLVLFGVAYLEFQGRRLNSAGEVKEGLGISVIGELPPLSGRTWRKIQAGGVVGNGLQARLTESIDSIRTTLIHTTAVESPRVVMVSSAEAQEGKTTVASQLAASLARSGRRTLLVDGDLRNPAAHRVFEVSLEPGLSEVLRGEATHEVAVQPTHSANLWVLTAGRCDTRSVQALSQSALAKLITALKAEFDFVIIDSGPVLKVADPLLIGQHVDAAVLSVLRDTSKVPRVYDASSRLSSVGVTVLGVVVNGITDRSQHYHPGALTNHEPTATATEPHAP